MKLFATAYEPARARFLEACSARKVAVQSLQHPSAKGPEGQSLHMDIAWLGASDAPDLLIVSSGTHGVEGLCGSGVQSWLLESHQDLLFPTDCALVMIHASNPHGFAHLRRVTEGNVDLNRNFIDHAAAPANAGYDEVHSFLVPAAWQGPARIAADLALAQYRSERGDLALQAAVSGGQYTHADGLFYGGSEPVWSNRMWRRFIAEHCNNRRQIVHVDLHTGLGPYGYGEKIVVMPPNSERYARAKQLLGDDIRSPWAGDSASAPVIGFVGEAFNTLPASTQTTLMALEFGTVSLEHMLSILRADNWLHTRENPNPDDARSMRHLMKAAFFVDAADWQLQVTGRTAEMLQQIARELPHR